MEHYAVKFKMYTPVMIADEEIPDWRPSLCFLGCYVITNPRWTETENVFEFDVYGWDGYSSTCRMNHFDLKMNVTDPKMADFEIIKYMTSKPFSKNYDFQFEKGTRRKGHKRKRSESEILRAKIREKSNNDYSTRRYAEDLEELIDNKIYKL